MSQSKSDGNAKSKNSRCQKIPVSEKGVAKLSSTALMKGKRQQKAECDDR
jgi:hypothetical protein